MGDWWQWRRAGGRDGKLLIRKENGEGEDHMGGARGRTCLI